MAKRRKNKKNKKIRQNSFLRKKNNFGKIFESARKKFSFLELPYEIKKLIFGVIVFILAIIVVLSFFDLAGIAGSFLIRGLVFLIGKAAFIIPLIFVLSGLVFLKARHKNFLGPTITAVLILIAGSAGFIESFISSDIRPGGWIGYILNLPLLKFFGILVARIIFGGIILIGGLIFWYLIKSSDTKESFNKKDGIEPEKKLSLIKKVFLPSFKVKEIESKIKEETISEAPVLELKKDFEPNKISREQEYKMPPLELLEADKGKAAAGDIGSNCAIIKKTLENFGVPVEMSEVNVGPTVTQYTLKPAEGIKLSKIVGLSNNLSLALASHPIRIEAPIPGKSLVGIEVPNKTRSQISLKDLIANSRFREFDSGIAIALGKDVSGNPCYADLSRMPHLLVAGATGSGKTIFLNSLILSLLYQNSPDILRFILVDPKRVEFSAYKDLPHLLTPVIFDPQKTINALKWLVLEMEKRFDILSGNGSRNISSYNEKVIKHGEKPLPYIVLIIDELADLMAAREREMEVGIVRLAQMARAVGIHLIVATQRPSVEVITGLIKANITSRISFQVASQIDSRTILDMSGAEKLLGAGDLLFISAELSKPKRIQGAYTSEKEIRKVTDYIRAQKEKLETEEADFGEVEFSGNHLAQDLEKSLEAKEGEIYNEDPLYGEAKKIIIEAKKASASLLQRRLRIGYARAARLLDILEENRVIGPGEGAKPREVYLSEKEDLPENITESSEEDEWKKV